VEPVVISREIGEPDDIILGDRSRLGGKLLADLEIVEEAAGQLAPR
jgi:hypothetical protein